MIAMEIIEVVGHGLICMIYVKFGNNPRKRSIENSFGSDMDFYERSFCPVMSLHSKRDRY